MSIWVLGATGRSGRDIVAALRDSGHDVVAAGRDAQRLESAAQGGAVVAGSFGVLLDRIRSSEPAVVVNTIGPFARTAAAVVDALAPGTHYVDIGNELRGFSSVLDRDAWARQRGSTLVVGAGNGVIATECAAIRVCEGRDAPVRLRVDAIPSLDLQAGVVGEALAGSLLGEAHTGGRRVEGGRLVPSGLATDTLRLTLPTGEIVATTAAPTGDLLAAWRVSGATSVIAANAEIPTGPLIRLAFPAVSFAMRSASLRSFAIRRLAAVTIKAKPRPREFAYGHATATWADGSTREVWLQLPDSHTLTVTGPAEIARRLVAGDVASGAYTPGALFGADFAVDLGGIFS